MLLLVVEKRFYVLIPKKRQNMPVGVGNLTIIGQIVTDFHKK